MLREMLNAAWSPHPGPDVRCRCRRGNTAGEHGRESALIGGAIMFADRVFGALSPPAGAGH
jgi:hypothetical protein